MKKKIALLLSLTVLSQGMGIFAAAEENRAGNTAEIVAGIEEPAVNESEEKIKAAIRESIKEETALLTSAGVIDLSEDYDPTKQVTRAEFAEFTAAAIKVEKQMEVSYFTDVPLSYWAVDSINSLADLNIISKASDGRFNPDRAITYVEACKMMAVMTGYDRYVNPDGGMNQYISIANNAGFGIVPSAKDKITVADAIKLLYNAMRVDLVMVDSVSGNKYMVKPNEGYNIFSSYHQIKFDDGRVEGVYGKSLSDTIIQTGKTRINDVDYYVAGTVSMDEYFGRYIEFAYKEKNKNYDSTVIYAKPKYKDDKMEIMYDDVVSYDEKTKKITYYEGEGNRAKKKIKTLSSGVTVIFNGRTYGKVLKTKLDEFVNGTRKGKVELISSNGSTDIDLVVITSYEIFAKDAYSASSKMFYADGGKRTLKIEDYSDYTIRDANNIAVHENQMTAGPYMIAESDDKEILSVIICSEKVEGTITSVGDDEVRIGDEIYEFDKQFYDDNYDKLQTGTAYAFYLDIYNKIIDMSVYSKDGMKNGYLTRASFTDGDLAEDIMFKLYTADDETYEWYRIADKIKIDGVLYKSGQVKDIIGALPGSLSVIDGTIKVDRQVVRYSTNEDGAINVIDTRNVLPNEDEDTTLRRITEDVKTGYYHGGRKVLGMRGYIDTSNVKYMVVPNTNDNGEIVLNGKTVEDTKNKYSNKFTFEDWKLYTYELFKYSSDTVAADLVVVYSDPLVANYTTIMYNKINEEVDDEGMVVNMLYGYSKGGETKLTVDETVDLSDVDISKGDIIRTETDTSGKIIYSITKMYDSNDGKFEPNGSWTDPDRYWYAADYTADNIGVYRGDHYQMSSGYVIDTKKNVVSLAYTIPMAYEGTISEIFSASGIPVTIFEPSLSKNAIYTGQLSDILTYKSMGEACDKVLVSCDNGTIKQIFVIRK